MPLRQECVDGHPERTAFYDATGTNIVRTNTGCVSFHFKLLSGDRRLWMINVNEQCAFQIGTSDENLDIVLNCITEDGKDARERTSLVWFGLHYEASC